MIRYAIRNNLLILGSLIALIFQYGCSSLQPLPVAARSGDTILLGIGTHRGLDQSDVTLTLISDAEPSNPMDITSGIRSVFNIYPDPTSEAARYSVASDIGLPMQTMVVLDLPLDLPHGDATIETDIDPAPEYPVGDQTIEILSGVGTPHDFDSALGGYLGIDISSMESLEHGIIKPSSVGNAFIAAAQFEVDFDEGAVNGDDLQAVILPKDTFDYNLMYVYYPNITWSHDGVSMRIQVLCPNSTIPQNLFRIEIISPPEVADPGLTLMGSKAWADDGTEITDIGFQLDIGR